jgi:RecA-family ATPase
MLIKGLLPFTGVAFVGGQSGSGKTFVAIDLAIALASAAAEKPTHFFRKRVKQSAGVAILAAEGLGMLGSLSPRMSTSDRCSPPAACASPF